MRSLAASLAVLALLVVLRPAEVHALTIDSFDSGAPFALENLGSGITLLQAASVLGGSREVVTLDRVEFDPAIGMSLIPTPVVYSTALSVGYRTDAVDLRADGADRFRVTLDSELCSGPDCPVFEVFVFLNDSGPGGSVFVASGPLGDGAFELPFGDSTAVESVTKIDFSLVVSQITYGDAYTVTYFRTVPEPSTALLLASGVLGLIVTRRKRA
jgi:hypothetical protein